MTDVLPEAQPTEGGALTIWNTQVQALVGAPEEAHAAATAIHESLMKLHTFFTENNMPKRATVVENAYNLVMGIYRSTESYGAALIAGQTAITEVDGQRKQAVTELQQLLKALDEGDEDHPKVFSFAEGIRELASDNGGPDDYYGDLLCEQVADEWDFDYDKADAVISAVLGNQSLTPRQTELFLAFANSLVEEDADAVMDGDE